MWVFFSHLISRYYQLITATKDHQYVPCVDLLDILDTSQNDCFYFVAAGLSREFMTYGGLPFRAVYPEFLPGPKPEYRNRLREKLERQDMLSRRSVMPIPEFYVGESLFIALSMLEMHYVEAS